MFSSLPRRFDCQDGTEVEDVDCTLGIGLGILSETQKIISKPDQNLPNHEWFLFLSTQKIEIEPEQNRQIPKYLKYNKILINFNIYIYIYINL